MVNMQRNKTVYKFIIVRVLLLAGLFYYIAVFYLKHSVNSVNYLYFMLQKK